MNNWQIEYIAEYNRQRVMEEVKQIRLENRAREARGNYASRAQQILLAFTNWMISKSKQLQKHYEATTANCDNPPCIASQINR